MSEHTPAPARPLARPFDRRTLVRTTTWGVPAVAVASAAPAFAISPPVTPGAPETVCTPRTAALWTGWSVTQGALNNPNANRSTGWIVRGRFGEANHITSNQAVWFDGTNLDKNMSGSSSQPDGAFLSFANNASTSAPAKVEVDYTFTVTGDAWVDIEGVLKFGYGDGAGTERQDVVVSASDGTSTYEVARYAHQRKGTAADPDANVYPPGGTTSNATRYAQLDKSDPEMRDDRFTLVHLPAGHENPVPYATTTPLHFPTPAGVDSSMAREVTVTFALTLHARATSAVNDDVIVNPPYVTVYC